MDFRKILLSSLLALGSLTLSAQYNTLSEWYVGPSAGASASTITLVPKYVDKMYSLGKNGGLTLRYISENHFGFQLECNYVEEGWLEDYNGTKSARQLFVRSSHELCGSSLFDAWPTLLPTPPRFFFNIGPKFSYLLSESETDRNTGCLPPNR